MSEEKKREALPDFVKGKYLNHLGVSSHSSCHQFESFEHEGWVIEAELAHVAFADEKGVGVFFGYGGGRIRAVIEDGDFGHDCASGVDVHDVFAAFFVVLEGAYLAVDDDKETLRFLAGKEEHFTFGEVNFDGLPGETRKLFGA